MIISDANQGSLRILQLHLGGDRNFQYLLVDTATGKAAAVDPGFAAGRFFDIAAEHKFEIQRILITHGHDDHNAGASELADLTGAVIHAGSDAAWPRAERLKDNQLLKVGGLSIQALATPGHAPDHYCFLCAESLVTGDLLFCGKVGGTGSYFAGSSARQEWDSLQRILLLPPQTRVYPGHDYYGGEGTLTVSTLENEKRTNPFLRCGGFDAFCELKENWAAYKREHGIR